jgi:DNA-binding PadR family transcriptional regulator
MLDMAILGLLEERDLHGYEIRRQLRDNLGILANVSFGSLYPALTRLEKAGAVVATDGSSAASGAAPAPPDAPPTGSLSGELSVLRSRRHSPSRGRRGKKVYRITETGLKLFAELLAEGGSVDDARSFGLPRPAWPCSNAGAPCWCNGWPKPGDPRPTTSTSTPALLCSTPPTACRRTSCGSTA